MKKLFSFFTCTLMLFAGNANATVCRLIPTTCYKTMGAGFSYDISNPNTWDITSSCWGKKKICVDALTNEYLASHNVSDFVALGQKEIINVIKPDFDASVLDGDCFGARKTKDGGAMVSVNGNFVNVWCSGVLDDLNITISDSFENGDITLGVQPTCGGLATNGYVNIPNGKCYGKYYNPNEYHIQCDGSNPTIIVLNGADPDNTATSTIKTKVQANTLFNTMYNNARTQHQIHFND